jgi:cysteine desulfurase
MAEHMAAVFGNPGSRQHAFGREAARIVDSTRRRIADSLGVASGEIVFTSGATESDNLALQGVARASADRGRHLVALATEHHAVLDTIAALGREGWQTSLVPVGTDGLVDPSELEAALRSNTVLVAAMAVNNEIGVIQPIEDIGRLCRSRGIWLFCDAAQAPGRLDLAALVPWVDLLALTGHKAYGPKGIGLLWRRRSGSNPPPLAPLLHGGGQEGGLRPGTLPVPLIAGLAEAVALAEEAREADESRLRTLADRLWAGLASRGARPVHNGSRVRRVAGNLNLRFPGLEAAALMAAVPEVAVSAGAACTTESPRPSHVLTALGLSAAECRSSLRFGLGRFTTAAQIDLAAERFGAAAAHFLGPAASDPAGQGCR